MVIHLTGLSNHWNRPRVCSKHPKKLWKNEVERLARNTKMFAPNVACVVVLNHVFKPEIVAFQVSTRFFL